MTSFRESICGQVKNRISDVGLGFMEESEQGGRLVKLYVMNPQDEKVLFVVRMGFMTEYCSVEAFEPYDFAMKHLAGNSYMEYGHYLEKDGTRYALSATAGKSYLSFADSNGQIPKAIDQIEKVAIGYAAELGLMPDLHSATRSELAKILLVIAQKKLPDEEGGKPLTEDDARMFVMMARGALKMESEPPVPDEEQPSFPFGRT